MADDVGHGAAPCEIGNVETIDVSALVGRVQRFAEEGRRFVTATCIDSGDSFEIYYHFAVGDALNHLRIVLPKDSKAPSISGVYFAAFLVENEIKELFGADIEGIAIDYGGHLLLTEGAPRTPMLKSPPNESV